MVKVPSSRLMIVDGFARMKWAVLLIIDHSVHDGVVVLMVVIVLIQHLIQNVTVISKSVHLPISLVLQTIHLYALVRTAVKLDSKQIRNSATGLQRTEWAARPNQYVTAPMLSA